MRDFLFLSLAGFFLLSTFSCKKESPLNDSGIPKISFRHPEIGQESRYVLLQGENIKHSANSNFEYLPDTLIAEIIEEQESKYLIKEYLTPGSASLNGENYVSFADSTIYYYLIKDDEMLKIENIHFRMAARLFFFKNTGTEGLETKEYSDLPLQMTGWKPSIPFTTDYKTGYLEEYELLGASYAHLNVVIDNRPMKDRSSGYTHIYSMKEGLVRSSTYNSLTGKGFGWDLLP